MKNGAKAKSIITNDVLYQLSYCGIQDRRLARAAVARRRPGSPAAPLFIYRRQGMTASRA
jgi:hypothetical protein